MHFGNRDNERFWIALIVRFAFGIMFISASLNILTYLDKTDPPDNPDRTAMQYFSESIKAFKTDLAAPFKGTWADFKWNKAPVAADAKVGAIVGGPSIGMTLVEWGVGITVCTTMITIFNQLAERELKSS